MFIIMSYQQQESQRYRNPDLFVLHVDFRCLPVLRGFLQACLQPDTLQIFLKFDLQGQRRQPIYYSEQSQRLLTIVNLGSRECPYSPASFSNVLPGLYDVETVSS